MNPSLRGDHQADCKIWLGRYYRQRALLEQEYQGFKNPICAGNQELITDEAFISRLQVLIDGDEIWWE